MFRKLVVSIFFATLILATKTQADPTQADLVDWKALQSLAKQNEEHFLHALESILFFPVPPPGAMQAPPAVGKGTGVQLPDFIQMELAQVIRPSAWVDTDSINYSVLGNRFRRVMRIFSSQTATPEEVLANLAGQMDGNTSYGLGIREFLMKNAARLGPEVQKNLVDVILRQQPYHGREGGGRLYQPLPRFQADLALQVLGEILNVSGTLSNYVRKLAEWHERRRESLHFFYSLDDDGKLTVAILSKGQFAREKCAQLF